MASRPRQRGTVVQHPSSEPKSNSNQNTSPTTNSNVHPRQEFVIPAHDEHGISVPISFRADKRYKAALSALVWSRKYPFRTDGDILRWCLDEGLKRLEEMEPGTIRSHIIEIDAINEQIRTVAAALEFAESVTALESGVQKLIAAKLRGLAVRMVYNVRKTAGKISEPLIRQHFLAEIQTRFGHLFSTNGDSVGLGAVSDETGSVEEEAMHQNWGFDAAESDLIPEVDMDEDSDL